MLYLAAIWLVINLLNKLAKIRYRNRIFVEPEALNEGSKEY